MTINPLKGKNFGDLILYEDKDLIVINKPPFVATLEDRNETTNILALARDYVPEAKVCHRLDKETSGLLVIARHLEAYKYFSKLLEQREVHKLYHAIVTGRHEIEEDELDFPIYTTSSRSRIDFQQGKPSVTLVKTIHIYKSHTLLACMPFTGRMHQIRAHLSHHDAPIVGDPSYGGSDIYLSEHKRNFNIGKFEEERPMIDRVALHAHAIAFRNMEGEIIEAQAPYPKDFGVLVKQLTKYN